LLQFRSDRVRGVAWTRACEHQPSRPLSRRHIAIHTHTKVQHPNRGHFHSLCHYLWTGCLSLTSLGSSDTINPLLFGADRGSRRVCRRQHKVSVLFLFLAIPFYFRCQVQVTTFSIMTGLMRKCDVLIRTVSTPHVLQLHHHVCSGSIRTEKTVPTRVPGLPVRDSARGCNNRAQMCAQLSAIDVTATALFERLYLVL